MFVLTPSTVAPGASLTASGTGAKKRMTRIRVGTTDPVMPNAILAEFTMPANSKFSRTINAPGGPDRSTTLVLQQKRADGAWAQTADVKLLLVTGGGGGTPTPPPNPPPTPPPNITPTNITQSAVSQTSVTISWTTTDASTGVVQYGITAGYGTTTAATSSGTSGSRTLTALQPGTLYHFRVVTTSGSTVIYSSDRTFTTQNTTPPPPPPPPTGLLFGTLNATPGQAGNYTPNALTIAGLQTGWDRHEKPSAGTWSAPDGATYASDFAAFKSAGLKVSLEMGLNYPPSFYQNSTYKFTDQFGTTSSGRALDWIWRATSRDKVEAYVRKLHTYVPFTDGTITDVRISTDEVSELLFPQDTQGGTTNSYWAYSGPAQTGTGLATGTVGGVSRNARVVPTGWAGWKPGDALPGGKPDVSEWYGWYLDSLVEATTWMTALLRSLGYAGRVWAVIPGQGARPTQQAAAYTARLASGTHSATMAVGSAFHLVYPRLAASGSGIGGWCSSAAENVLMTDITQAGDAAISTQNEGWSSHRMHAWLAVRNGMARAVENPGGGTSGYGLTMMDYLVRQARACSASVCSWAHETNLVNGTGGSNGGAVSFAGYRAYILGTTGTIISNVAISNVTTTGATVSWSVTPNANGQVEYGTTTGYGQTTTLETSYLASHSQTLSGLTPGVTYHFRVRSQGPSGPLVVSSDRTFTTQAVVPTPPGTYPPETSLTWVPTNGDARPGYLQEITDSTWGTKIRRISNVNLYTNAYPKQQPWNVGGTRIFLGNGFRMLNGTTYADLGDGVRPFGVEYPVWSNVNSDYMYGCSEGQNVIKRWSVAGNAWTTIHTFAGKGHCSLGDYEGNISDNDTRIALIYNTLSNQSGTWGVLVYDPVNNVEISSIAIGTGAASHPNNCMISRSGAYVVIQHGVGGTGTSQGTWLYDSATLTRIRQISAVRPHADMGKDAASNDIYVHMEGPAGVTSHRCSNGAIIDLLPSGTILDAGHVSCTNYDRPGYAYISSNSRSTGSKGSDQLIAVKTDGSQVVEVYAFAHAAGDQTYDQAPHMAASRDGSKIIFRSNWGTTGIYAYVAGRVT